MGKSETDEVREFWNRVADDWQIQIGAAGDSNRVLNSDPVLWAFAGDVGGLKVLDAGCGTGYLSRQLSDRGAVVAGIDISERMIDIARARHPNIDFRVDSCSEIRTVRNAEFDLVIANHVLMDTPDLEGATYAFNRILRLGGIAVLVFSHPCFPQGRRRAPPTAARQITAGRFLILSEEDASTLPGDTSPRTSPGFIGRCLTTGRHLRRRDSSYWISKNPESPRNGTTLPRLHESSRIARPGLIRLHSNCRKRAKLNRLAPRSS